MILSSFPTGLKKIASNTDASAFQSFSVQVPRVVALLVELRFIVTLSSGSCPGKIESKMAASRTVRAIGPAVSCEDEIGMIPERLINPTVGLIPTMPHAEEGQTIEPFVSVPIATEQRFAETAVPNQSSTRMDCDRARRGFWFDHLDHSIRLSNKSCECWPIHSSSSCQE